MLEHCNYIRRHGVLQFLSIYRRMQHLENDPFFYGDDAWRAWRLFVARF